MSLGDYIGSRNNNFNLLRFIAACLVVISHSFALVHGSSSAEPLKSSLGITWGMIAVDIFFVTSGFLIAGSFYSKPKIEDFFLARFLRIFPALLISLFFCAYIIGPLFTSLPLLDYLFSSGPFFFLIRNFVLLLGIEYQLPGLFLDNAYPSAVNGSLWTLPYELKMYILLYFFFTVLVKLRERFNSLNEEVVIWIFVALLFILFLLTPYFSFLSSKFIRLSLFFSIGSAFFVSSKRVKLHSFYFIVLLFCLIISTSNSSFFYFVYPLCLPYLIFYLAYFSTGFLLNFNKLGDYSYGIYIYSFPLQQTLIFLLDDITVLECIIYSFFVSLCFAILSWHFIEKPALRYKSNEFLRSRISACFSFF